MKIKKILIFVLLVVLLGSLSACKETPNSRIETKLSEYLKSNFSTNSEVESYTILKTDSVNVWSMAKKTLETYDSVFALHEEVRDEFTKLSNVASASKRFAIRDEVVDEVLWLREFIDYIMPELQYSRKKLFVQLTEVDSMRPNHFSYKVALKLKNNQSMEIYAEDLPFMDSVAFTNEPLDLHQYPEPIKSINDNCVDILTNLSQVSEHTVKLKRLSQKLK